MRDSRYVAVTRLLIAIAAFGSLIVSIYNTTQILEVHLVVNSRLTELLKLTGEAALAKGLKEGREEKR